jgi:glucokinase
MTISSGIGCGIVIDGRIHRGRHGLAGEVWAFYPGSFTGIETPNVNDIASGTGMVMQAKKRMARGEQTALPADGLDMRHILRAAAGGDPLAKAVMEDSQRALAATISAALHVLAPDVVVVGGGLAAQECGFVEPIRERVADMIGLSALAETPIRRAELWDCAVLYGAIELGRALWRDRRIIE